ncbi:MAG: hypothetical protein ACT4OO_07655 [Nitrospiraceae bacterium]
MKRLVLRGFLIIFVLALGACGGPWRDSYFKKGLHRITKEEVQEKLGPPHTAKTPSLGGDTVWTYRYPMSDKELNPYDPRNITRGAAEAGQAAAALFGKGGGEGARDTLYCYRYILTFDESKVLKSWKREDCVPRNPEKTASP